ncbi:DNA glycosylase AlkZ-like family protein [Antribacter gilvus]|uniref:DNA glycosylase AlkZ-like family protein n=1 Tax=Antribacter gilvus TaxID=2304675 RepID=UPI000F77AA16|nr:crosslink repair DNA glycosylase YcaQ family protein [Antribacter gilvus]
MALLRLTVEQARRLAVRAQRLDAHRPTDLLRTVEHLTYLPVDPTSAVAPAVDLISWSRLGASYWQGAVDDAVRDRMMFQLVGTVRSMADIGLYLAEMAAWPPPGPYGQSWVEANDAFRRDVLALLRDDGPLLAREIPDTSQVPWQSTGWTGNRNVNQLLELLSRRGQVAIAGKEGRERLWDLAERVYPAVDPVPFDEARAERERRRIRAMGISRLRQPGVAGDPWYVEVGGEPAVVDGIDGEWRVDVEALEGLGDFEGRTALLSPFDRLVADRDRLLQIFDFEYIVEMFKPKAKRRWGYFALPVLHHDRFVGKVDVTADRKGGLLRVNAIHEDLPFSAEVEAAVDAELESLARWLRLELVSV